MNSLAKQGISITNSELPIGSNSVLLESKKSVSFACFFLFQMQFLYSHKYPHILNVQFKMYKYTGKNLKQTVITSEIILYHFVFRILLKEKKIPQFFKLKKVHMLFFST